DHVERSIDGSGDVPFRATIVCRGAHIDHDDLLAVEDHFRRHRRRDLAETAARFRDADGVAGRQKAERREKKCSADLHAKPACDHFCLLLSAFCLHKISKSNSARTSPTIAPATFATGSFRKGCRSGAMAMSTPRSSSVLRITG